MAFFWHGTWIEHWFCHVLYLVRHSDGVSFQNYSWSIRCAIHPRTSPWPSMMSARSMRKNWRFGICTALSLPALSSCLLMKYLIWIGRSSMFGLFSASAPTLNGSKINMASREQASQIEWMARTWMVTSSSSKVLERKDRQAIRKDMYLTTNGKWKGGTRYDWRIFDTPRKNNRLYKYSDSLDIFQLRAREEKLIHFSSLFGTGKLPIRRPEHYEFRRMLQRSITYKHPAVLALAEQVVNLLGGAGNYVGLHVR